MFESDDIRGEKEVPVGSEQLRAAFPVFMQKDFESPVNNAAYKVGVDKSYPADLRKMISAAVLTYQLNNKSIDYVLRRYLKGKDYTEKSVEERVDRVYQHACLAQASLLQKMLEKYPQLTQREPRIGEWIGDLTLMRISYSLQRAFGEANRGALFESVAIARMILEQLAWTVAVRDSDDPIKVQKLPATKSIGVLSIKSPAAGRLYGWMSDHAHWGYEAHYKVITSENGFSEAWLFNHQFKAIAYAMLIALTVILTQVAYYILQEYRELEDTSEFKLWNYQSGGFDGVAMIEKIYDLDKDSLDILTILNIVKVAANHG
ncbi:hypothetical protein [Rhizobium leguminosarum]|uniref:hypothetical protein n=1 Tax=Rhizobium leguminosarum TaxID=384 RepID=UPI000489C741|nr:hypothetical protein [Rhizobium leguminosarum]